MNEKNELIKLEKEIKKLERITRDKHEQNLKTFLSFGGAAVTFLTLPFLQFLPSNLYTGFLFALTALMGTFTAFATVNTFRTINFCSNKENLEELKKEYAEKTCELCNDMENVSYLRQEAVINQTEEKVATQTISKAQVIANTIKKIKKQQVKQNRAQVKTEEIEK